MATISLAALAACATTPAPEPVVAPTTPEARQDYVSARAKARWEALIKDDVETAYSYMSPGSRQVTTLDKYKATIRRGAYRAIAVESVVCDADTCKVRLLLTYDHAKMKGITTAINETWLFDGGQAWIVT